MKIRKLSPIRKTKKNSKNANEPDICLVCEEDLYFDEVASRRIGMLDEDGFIIEWKCPYCHSEFDIDNNLKYIYGSEIEGGKT